jgi:hypothetical protein
MKRSLACLLFLSCLIQLHCVTGKQHGNASIKNDALVTMQQQLLTEAAWAMQQEPVTITSESSPRSAGGKHDFFSEADYFWPDPKNPNGPYINRDGMTNPDNFVAHRKAMIRLSKVVAALASAYQITHDEKYVTQAIKHLRAWFIDTDTYMNPNLQFSQAVKGLFTGRNYGIIDTIHLMEVAQAVLVMQEAGVFDQQTLEGIKLWFHRYNEWLNTSKMGLDEKNTKNNHSTCWAMQVASFAKLSGDQYWMDTCANLYKRVLLPNQMGVDGSFPLELARTKPYGYSLFNLDAMATLCQILSTNKNDLWNYSLPDGRCVKKAIDWLYPFVADKNKWTFKPDVMYWNDWPVAHPFLLFGANRFNVQQWLDTWKQLDHDPKVEELVRNLPIRHPLLWI